MARLGAEGNACGGTPTKRASDYSLFSATGTPIGSRPGLALAGVSAGIQRVVINGSDVWYSYSVRVGPFNDLKSLRGARQRLTEGRFNYMLVKVETGDGAG